MCLAVALAAPAQVLTASGNQAPLKNMSLEQLSQVEVTTTAKEPRPVHRIAAATYVITSEDIRRSGVTSIADALRLAPGVEVSRISSTTWAIGIRGLQSNFSKSVLVLIDGRSVYTPLFAGVYWDVQDMPLEDIDRIEVVRGPGATIWGPNAVNGVINIFTKTSADTQGVMVSALGGTQDRTIDTIRYGGRISKDATYRVFARGFLREPEYHRDLIDYDQWHQERGGFRLDWSPHKDSFLLEGDIYGGDSPRQQAPNTISDDKVSGGDIVARWRHTFSDRSDLYLQAYFDRTIRIGVFGETRDTIDLDFLHHIKLGNRNDLSWGGGLRWSPNRFIPVPGVIDIIPEVETDYIHSGFAQDTVSFLNGRLEFTVGAKFTVNNYSGFDSQPSGRVLWAPNKKQSYWAAISRAVTTPSRIEENFLLRGATPLFLLQVAGNPKFRSEKMLGYEAGFRELFTPKFYVDVAAFHNNYTDLQSFGPNIVTPPPPQLTITIPYTNYIGGWTNGFEIAPSWQRMDWWRLSGSYSYVGIDTHANVPNLADISSTGSVATYDGSTPHHMVEIQSTLNLPAGFEFDQFYRYASSLPAQKVPSYHTMDVRLGWKIRSRLELSVVGQNLFQPHHAEWG
ncbi:MAG: TonB-dependent receptor plug domain-containing protein, partial [Terriglobales bacterium]